MSEDILGEMKKDWSTKPTLKCEEKDTSIMIKNLHKVTGIDHISKRTLSKFKNLDDVEDYLTDDVLETIQLNLINLLDMQGYRIKKYNVTEVNWCTWILFRDAFWCSKGERL